LQLGPWRERHLAAEAITLLTTWSAIRDEALLCTADVLHYLRSGLKPARTSSQKDLRLFPRGEVPTLSTLL